MIAKYVAKKVAGHWVVKNPEGKMIATCDNQKEAIKLAKFHNG